MAHIDFRLDTDPMAQQITGVKNHVDVTTAAVVTMQSAVIQAESEAADHVCSNVNKGFHTLIRSQISQKIAKLSSDVEAKILELSQQSVALGNIKNRMTRDYHMIARRYAKLFNSINSSLQQQIFELDKKAVSFVTKDIKLQAKRADQLIGSIPINQSESILLSQSIISSRTKQNGAKLIDAIKKFISNIHYQDHLVKSIVYKKSIDKQQSYFIPVIIVSSKAGDVANLRYFLPEDNFTTVTEMIDSRVKSVIYDNADSLRWKSTPLEELTKVSSEFQSLIVESKDSDRVKQTMRSLFEKCGTINKLTN